MVREDDHFITWYKFTEDRSRPRRVLLGARIGGVYVAELILEPGAVAGNHYHKKTNSIFLVGRGKIRGGFERVDDGERLDFTAEPGSGIMHLPPKTAVAIKNVVADKTVVIFFANRPFRSGDDVDFPIDLSLPDGEFDDAAEVATPIKRYRFQHDQSKPGRDLETAKVGGVYVSRLTLMPNVISGNLYHKKAKVILFVTSGFVRFRFKHVKSGETREFDLKPGGGIVHIPPYVAIANKNLGAEPATIMYFSTLPFRQDDDYPFELYHESIKT